MRPLRYILVISFFLLSGKALGQCNTPVVTFFSNIYWNSVQVNYTCCQTGIYYLEYGLSGFTPGTTTNASPGGIVITAQANPGSQTINGLVANTLYDVYVRVQCDTGGWTSNSIVKTFRTGGSCNTAQTITCDVDYQVVLPSGLGAWPNWFCSVPGALGREKLYRFTPTVTGNYFFHAGNASGTGNRVSFRYRADTLPCNEMNWNCLQTAQPGAPTSLQFGPLIAGKTYLFLADAELQTSPPDTAFFRIECTMSCLPPTSISITGVSPEKVRVNFAGGSNTIFEYGPVGFVPGSSNLPGTNGIIKYVNTGGTVSGLTTGTLYHGYFRTICTLGAWTYYSANSSPILFQPLICLPPVTYNMVAGMQGFYMNSPWSGTTFSNYDGVCGPGFYPGNDKRIIFTIPKTAHYTLDLFVSPYSTLEVSMKNYNSDCRTSSYNCLPQNFGANPQKIPLGVLTKDSTYDILLDTYDSTEVYTVFNIECSSPENITASNITPTSFDLNWSCNCTDTVFIEIGPAGFNPGTGLSAGANGSLSHTTGTSFSFSNLTPLTEYDVYLRTHCGTIFSPNKKVTVFTPVDCQQSPIVTCGDHVNYFYNGNLNYYPLGAWNVQSCNGGSLWAEETLFKFTPSQSGMYYIDAYDLVSNWTGIIFTVKYFFKPASSGCNPLNWVCIGTLLSSAPAFTPQRLAFGPLNAGETYYIMADGVQSQYKAYYLLARLLCQGVCNGPELIAANPLHPDGGSIQALCGSCFDDGILEIGPQGFTPGTDSLPGINGSVYQNVIFPYNVYGLTPGLTYDVYARSNCSTDTVLNAGFSTNSGPLSFTPCSTIPAPITTSANGVPVCEGESVMLYRNGGIAAPGTVYRWYENGCGSGNFIGTGDSIVVTPSNTTTYFMRAEAPCGNTGCVSVQIQVANTPPVFTGNTSYCAGDSTTLSVQSPFVQYSWSTGDTTSSINVNSPGLYSLTAINNNGCQVNGSIAVTEISFYPPQISGNTGVCVGDSTVLFAGNGYATYLWSNGSTVPFITIGDSGTYSVTVSNLAGCSGSDSVQVSLNQPPVVSITAQSSLSFCLGDSVLLTSSPGLTGWQWYRSQIPIAGATDPQFWIKTAGSYFCIGSDAFECADTSNMLTAFTRCIIIGSPQDKINESQPFHATVFSNPSGEPPVVRVQCPENAQIDFQLFDSLGKLVGVSADIIHTGEYRLDFSGRAGIYILQVRCDNEVQNLKLIR